MNDVECPYCEEQVEINHDDGYGYEEGKTYEQECSHCGKTFVYTTGIIFVYTTGIAPCKNGENHEWKQVHGLPIGYQSNRHQCKWCDKIEFIDKTLKYNADKDVWEKGVI